MKLDQETKINAETSEKVNTLESKKIEEDEQDNPYSQVNTISFQRNFKVLIGHYKINEHSPRAG